MKASTINLINSLVLIIFGTWGYFDFETSQSLTAFIPVGFGVILLICQNGVKTENKVIAHIAVVLTFLILIALASKIPGKLESQGLGLLRICSMTFTCLLSMIAFVLSFIKARRG